MDIDFIQKSRNEAIAWAKGLKSRDPETWVILDTETTGLGPNDEVVEIGVIDGSGRVLINNQLVDPGCAITDGAYAVHGISRLSVRDAPIFDDLSMFLSDVLRGKLVVIYNSDYDTRILKQSSKRINFDVRDVAGGVECAMLKYAEFVGDWNEYHQSFKWQRLPAGDHSAVGDCVATLKIINKMAEGEMS